MSEAQATGPLKGVKIVDMSTVVLGPLATMMLGDLGADIIKIENGAGDIMRHAGKTPTKGLGPIYTALNRNKKSVAIDAKDPEGKAQIEKLLKTADVFFHNVRMAGMKRLGLDYEAVKAINPNIVYVHCAGFGSDGPYAKLQAYDDLIQGVSGFADMERIRSGGAPAYVPSLIADKTVGMMALQATLAGLYAQKAQGVGQFIEVPMFESFTFFHMAENLYGKTFEETPGNLAYTRSVNSNRKPYPTADGYICLVPYNDQQWETFFQLAGRDGVFDDPRFETYSARTENIKELYGLIEECTASKTTEEWLLLLAEANIPAMKFQSMEEVIDDPHLKAVEFFEMREHPHAGQYRSLKHPVKYSETPTNFRHHPPLMGEDSDEILG